MREFRSMTTSVSELRCLHQRERVPAGIRTKCAVRAADPRAMRCPAAVAAAHNSAWLAQFLGTNALQRPQDMVVRARPIRSMMEAGVDVVPRHLHHPRSTEGHGTFAKGARAELSVSPKN